MSRELLFRVTAADCIFTTFKGSGAGGQKKNKTSSGIICRHRASGAVGRASDGRSQTLNKRAAFRRMAETPEFDAWLKIEAARRNGTLAKAESAARQSMRDENLRVEVKGDGGKWIETDEVSDEEVVDG